MIARTGFLKSTTILSLFLFLSCTETAQDVSALFPHAKSANYFKKSQSLTLEVHYEPDAESGPKYMVGARCR